MNKRQNLYIFLKDDDTRKFALTGPVEHRAVNEWIDKELAAKKLGRRVSVADLFEQYVEAAVADALKQDFSPVSADEIIQPPKDRSAEYIGSLPSYALKADRDRIVKILCRGPCKAERWAELNVKFPGKKALSEPGIEPFSARCLRCGSIARDSYNWYR